MVKLRQTHRLDFTGPNSSPHSGQVALAGPRDRLIGVQYLRALAAFTVMVSHAMGDIAAHGGPDLWRFSYVGAAGVDLFFIISGFVMIYAARALFGIPGGAVLFLRKRLARIVPLYWLATLVYALVQIGRGNWFVLRPDLLASSLSFWPYADSGGLHLPVYSIGWTLNCEMFFYAVFAIGLLFRRRTGLVLISGGLLGLVLTGMVVPLPQPLRFWSQPVLIEFLLGLAVGLVYIRGWRLPRLLAPVLVIVAVVLFAAGILMGYNAMPNEPETFPRWIAWGIPATLAFAAVVLPRQLTARPHPWLALLGDSSYSIYLIHPIIIIVSRPIVRWVLTESVKTGSGGYAVAISSVVVLVTLVSFVSVTVYEHIERPVARFLSRA